jgi:FMN phosphatase YigB (HAD superfamily)
VPLILFDLDDTLLSRAAALDRWSLKLSDVFDLDRSATEFVRLADHGGRTDREMFLEMIRLEFSISIDSAEFFAWYLGSYPGCFSADLRTIAALGEAYQRRWPMAIVSNGVLPRQLAKLKAAGIAQYFSAVCCSSDTGFRKPDPRIFAAAAERVGSPLAGWMVGDSYMDDVLGGVAAGLRCAWITDCDLRGRTDVADVVVHDVAGALIAIDAHESRADS